MVTPALQPHATLDAGQMRSAVLHLLFPGEMEAIRQLDNGAGAPDPVTGVRPIKSIAQIMADDAEVQERLLVLGDRLYAAAQGDTHRDFKRLQQVAALYGNAIEMFDKDVGVKIVRVQKPGAAAPVKEACFDPSTKETDERIEALVELITGNHPPDFRSTLGAWQHQVSLVPSQIDAIRQAAPSYTLGDDFRFAPIDVRIISQFEFQRFVLQKAYPQDWAELRQLEQQAEAAAQNSGQAPDFTQANQRQAIALEQVYTDLADPAKKAKFQQYALMLGVLTNQVKQSTIENGEIKTPDPVTARDAFNFFGKAMGPLRLSKQLAFTAHQLDNLDKQLTLPVVQATPANAVSHTLTPSATLTAGTPAPPAPPGRVSRWFKRNKKYLVGSGVVAGLLIAGQYRENIADFFSKTKFVNPSSAVFNRDASIKDDGLPNTTEFTGNSETTVQGNGNGAWPVQPVSQTTAVSDEPAPPVAATVNAAVQTDDHADDHDAPSAAADTTTTHSDKKPAGTISAKTFSKAFDAYHKHAQTERKAGKMPSALFDVKGEKFLDVKREQLPALASAMGLDVDKLLKKVGKVKAEDLTTGDMLSEIRRFVGNHVGKDDLKNVTTSDIDTVMTQIIAQMRDQIEQDAKTAATNAAPASLTTAADTAVTVVTAAAPTVAKADSAATDTADLYSNMVSAIDNDTTAQASSVNAYTTRADSAHTAAEEMKPNGEIAVDLGRARHAKLIDSLHTDFAAKGFKAVYTHYENNTTQSDAVLTAAMHKDIIKGRAGLTLASDHLKVTMTDKYIQTDIINPKLDAKQQYEALLESNRALMQNLAQQGHKGIALTDGMQSEQYIMATLQAASENNIVVNHNSVVQVINEQYKHDPAAQQRLRTVLLETESHAADDVTRLRAQTELKRMQGNGGSITTQAQAAPQQPTQTVNLADHFTTTPGIKRMPLPELPGSRPFVP